MRQRHFLTLPQSKERREKALDRMWYEHGTNMVRTWYEEDFGKVFGYLNHYTNLFLLFYILTINILQGKHQSILQVKGILISMKPDRTWLLFYILRRPAGLRIASTNSTYNQGFLVNKSSESRLNKKHSFNEECFLFMVWIWPIRVCLANSNLTYEWHQRLQ